MGVLSRGVFGRRDSPSTCCNIVLKTCLGTADYQALSCVSEPTLQLSALQVSRAVRSADVTDTIDAGLSWPLQLLSALQQRGYIASAGASDRPPGFVFDIDGVLIRGSRVLEPAKKALARLCGDGGIDFLLSHGRALQ